MAFLTHAAAMLLGVASAMRPGHDARRWRRLATPRCPMLAGCALLAAVCCGAALAATTDIGQSGQAFTQTRITIKPGDRLNFRNQDDVNHNIVIQTDDDDDDGRDLGVQPPGGSVSFVFDKSGKFRVRCHIHPGMRLNVTVQ